MRAGELDHKITLQQISVTRSALGDEIKTWATLATPWAKVIPVSGREFANATAEARFSGKVNRFRIRYLAAARKDTALRVLYDGDTYDIKHIAEIGRRVGLELVGETMGQP